MVFDDRGRRVSVDSLRSRVTVVGLWAAYCEPCASRMEAVAQLADHYADSQDVAVLLINVDEPSMLEFARDKAARRAPSVPFYYAQGYGAVAKLFPLREETGRRVISLPLVLVLAEDDTIRYTYNSDVSNEAYVDSQTALVDDALRGVLRANDDEPPRTVELRIESTPSGAFSFTVMRMGKGVAAVADAIIDLSGWSEGTQAEQAELRARIETMLAEGGDRIVVELWAPDDDSE